MASLVLLASCGPVRDGGVAIIHQSWDARFNYDYEKRRLISVHEKKMRGRSWGRDEYGRVDYDRFWTGRPILSQNLLGSYKARLDAKLEDRWKASEDERVARRAEEMENETRAGAEKEAGEGEKPEGDEGGFTPAPFLPEGIESENETPGNGDDAPPFLPLPEAPALPESDPNALPLPEVDPEAAPPPFDPLPPV